MLTSIFKRARGTPIVTPGVRAYALSWEFSYPGKILINLFKLEEFFCPVLKAGHQSTCTFRSLKITKNHRVLESRKVETMSKKNSIILLGAKKSGKHALIAG